MKQMFHMAVLCLSVCVRIHTDGRRHTSDKYPNGLDLLDVFVTMFLVERYLRVVGVPFLVEHHQQIF